MDAGMAVPDRPSTIDLEAEPPDSKRSRKMPPTAKARPTRSGADELEQPSTSSSSWGPRQPAEAPPTPPANKRKDTNTIDVKDKDCDQWMQAKIAEAADDDDDGHGGDDDSGDWHDDGKGEANELGFEKSWQMALQQYKVDKAAQLQLAVLRDQDWYAASDVVWKLTKKGSYDDELKNPSGFVNRCCTTAFKNVKW
jgi:hypothetical protein